MFWIHSSSVARFNQAFKEIARQLNLPNSDDPVTDTLYLVADWLSDDDNGQWLMVLDGADDQDAFFTCTESLTLEIEGQQQPKRLVDYLPRSLSGSILITTRDKRVGERLSYREGTIPILP